VANPRISFEGDGTLEPVRYEIETVHGIVNIWDLPGQGTLLIPARTYLRDMGLKYYSGVILTTDGRFDTNDLALQQAISFAQIWSIVVHTKADLAVESGQYDHNMSQAESLQAVRDTLSQQMDIRDPAKIQVVTTRRRFWNGEHGGDGFGNISDLCMVLQQRVNSGDILDGGTQMDDEDAMSTDEEMPEPNSGWWDTGESWNLIESPSDETP